MAITSEKLKMLEAQQEEIRSHLRKIRDDINDELRKLIEEKFGVNLGCIVKVNGEDYRVTTIILSACRDKPWLEGSPRKKDGSFGRAIRNLYGDWELVSPAAEAQP